MRKYDVISIFQDGGRGGSILLPLSCLLRSSESQNLLANQISSTDLNSGLKYNYFRFGKTNVRHIGNLLPVSTLITSPQSASYSFSKFQKSLISYI